MRRERHRLIFIDETGTTTKLTRLRGRSLKGERLNGKAPFGHWGTQTFVAGLKCDGLIAPWVIDAPMNRAIFETYVETQLAPALTPGDVVIMDNLSSHKSQQAENAIRARGAWLLFLPPPAFAGAGSTAPISIPSRWPSQNSSPTSAQPRPEPSMTSGRPSETSANSSRQKNVRTTSQQPDMDSTDHPML